MIISISKKSRKIRKVLEKKVLSNSSKCHSSKYWYFGMLNMVREHILDFVKDTLEVFVQKSCNCKECTRISSNLFMERIGDSGFAKYRHKLRNVLSNRNSVS